MKVRDSHTLLRRYIREQAARIGGLGSRNIFTVDDEPISWDSLPGYDVEITYGLDDTYTVDVFFKDKKLGYSRQFNNNEEANHYARSVVDKHRISNTLDE
jgi:hypothetical protein